MKRLIILCFLWALVVGYLKADVLCVTTRDADSPTYINLDGRPVITFEGESVLIKTDDKTIEYSLSSFVTFTFTEGTDIQKIKTDGLKLKIEGGNIYIYGLEESVDVSVYAMNGNIIASGKTNIDGFWKSYIETGTYVIRIGSRTIKMMVR